MPLLSFYKYIHQRVSVAYIIICSNARILVEILDIVLLSIVLGGINEEGNGSHSVCAKSYRRGMVGKYHYLEVLVC